jgi:hypothetical protein
MARLIIGSIEIPDQASMDFTQTYKVQSAIDFRRAADGSGFLRELWTGKLSTTIQARGWVAGVDDLALGQSHVIACAMYRAINATGTSIALPATRRSDAEFDPIGFALVDDQLVETPITNIAAINAGSEDTATLTAVAGASGYRVHYWPLITAAIVALTSNGNSRASFEWQLEAEEL